MHSYKKSVISSSLTSFVLPIFPNVLRLTRKNITFLLLDRERERERNIKRKRLRKRRRDSVMVTSEGGERKRSCAVPVEELERRKEANAKSARVSQWSARDTLYG